MFNLKRFGMVILAVGVGAAACQAGLDLLKLTGMSIGDAATRFGAPNRSVKLKARFGKGSGPDILSLLNGGIPTGAPWSRFEELEWHRLLGFGLSEGDQLVALYRDGKLQSLTLTVSFKGKRRQMRAKAYQMAGLPVLEAKKSLYVEEDSRPGIVAPDGSKWDLTVSESEWLTGDVRPYTSECLFSFTLRRGDQPEAGDLEEQTQYELDLGKGTTLDRVSLQRESTDPAKVLELAPLGETPPLGAPRVSHTYSMNGYQLFTSTYVVKVQNPSFKDWMVTASVNNYAPGSLTFVRRDVGMKEMVVGYRQGQATPSADGTESPNDTVKRLAMQTGLSINADGTYTISFWDGSKSVDIASGTWALTGAHVTCTPKQSLLARSLLKFDLSKTLEFNLEDDGSLRCNGPRNGDTDVTKLELFFVKPQNLP